MLNLIFYSHALGYALKDKVGFLNFLPSGGIEEIQENRTMEVLVERDKEIYMVIINRPEVKKIGRASCRERV